MGSLFSLQMDHRVFGGVNLGIYFNGLIFRVIILVNYFLAMWGYRD